MSVKVQKDIVIYDDEVFRTGFGYPRGSINGMIRFNELINDFEFGVNEEWIPLGSIVQHPLNDLIRYNTDIKDFEFLIEGVWTPRCDCPSPIPEPPEPPGPRPPLPPRTRPDSLEYDLQVNIIPSAVRSQAEWAVSGYPGSYSHGTIIRVKVGSYAIYSLDVPGWKTPEIVNTNVHSGMPGDIRIVNVEYTAREFSIVVIVEPEDLREQMTWTVAGVPRAHDETATGLSTGFYTVTFSHIPGWTTPEPVNVHFKYNDFSDTRIIHVEYTEKTYGIQVLFEPEQARAEAWWAVSSMPGTFMHGDVLSGVEYGEQTVNISDVTGWITPEPIVVDITDGMPNDIKVITVNLNSEEYFINVRFEPDEVIDTATWQVAGQTGTFVHDDNALVTYGEHTAVFNAVPGWATPAAQTVMLEPGLLFNTRKIRAIYTPLPLSVQVSFEPPGVRAQARWYVLGYAGLLQHGETLTGVTEGMLIVKFEDVTGWITPEDVETTVSRGMTDNTRYLTVTYTQAEIELQVLIEPSEVRNHTQWYLEEIAAPPRFSHEHILSLTPGTYTVRGTPHFGWDTPAPLPVTLDHSINSDTNVVTIEYTEQPEADIRCDNVIIEGSKELENQTFYIGEDINYIEIIFQPSWRPDRMCIYEGIHTDLTGADVDNGLDPWTTHLLYDSGWRTKDDTWSTWNPPGIDPDVLYPGVQNDPPGRKYCIDTSNWTGNVKTIIVYGKDDDTQWWIEGVTCYQTAPACPGSNPPSFRPTIY